VSLAQRVRLELEDGREIETMYDGRDLRAWEAAFNKSAIVEDLGVGMLTWLGHHAAIRRGELNGDLTSYAAFDKVCVSVEGIRAEPPDPTKGPAKRSKGSRARAGDEPSPR